MGDEQSNDEDGVIVALLERLSNHRLPRALDLKARVDEGARLDDNDVAFLKRVLESAQEVKRVADRHPEYQDVVARAIHLYHEITTKALENEENN